MENIVFLGAGAAFYEIYELIHDINQKEQKYKIIAILDDNESLHGKILNEIKVEGMLAEAKNYKDAKFVYGIGSLKTRIERRKIIDRLGIPHDRFVTLIHPSAKIYSSAKIGNGCIIHHGCLIGASAVLDDFVITTFYATVGNYAQIGAYSMIATASLIMNNVKIGSQVFVGARSIVADNVKVDDLAVVGLGTLVVNNIKRNKFVLGNPGRMIGEADNWM